MIVQVKLFAVARDVAGMSTAELELPAGASVAQLRRALAGRYPALAATLRLSRIAVNADFAAENAILQAGDEIALIPPVSGG